jgi:hypothetical protein
MCGVAATPITVRIRAVALDTMSVCMSTNAYPTVLPEHEPPQTFVVIMAEHLSASMHAKQLRPFAVDTRGGATSGPLRPDDAMDVRSVANCKALDVELRARFACAGERHSIYDPPRKRRDE